MLACAALSALALAAVDPAGPGFDCEKASTPDEKLVCAVPELAGLDRRMAVLWSWKLAAADESKHDAAKKFQRGWLTKRAACAAGAKAPAGREAQVACARALYRARIADLEKGMGPVPDAILVVHRVHRAAKRGCEEVTISWPELVGTELRGAGDFNAYFAEEEREPECVNPKELPDAAPGDFSRSSSVLWSNARFVTIARGTYQYSAGAAHPNHDSMLVTFDLERGDEVGVDDVFSGAPEVREKLLAFVEKRLFPESEPPQPEDLREKAFTQGHWAFTEAGAILHFSPYEIGPYSAGDFEEKFTWKELRPFLAEGSPFPLGR